MTAASSSAPTSTNNQGQSTSTAASSVPTDIQTSGSSYSGPSGDYSQMPLAFPKVIKVEERRVPRGSAAIQPYCIQKILDPSGAPQIYPNSTGQPNIIYLNETAPSSVSQITDKRDTEEYLEQRDRDLIERQSANSCSCAWIWT
jgi:hypothetical protein